MVHLIFAALFLALIVLAILSTLMRNRVYTIQHEYRVVSPADFPQLDMAYYERTQGKLEALGFTFLGDVENVTLRPWSRAMIRHMASSDGLTMAEFYHARFRTWLRVLQMLTPGGWDLRLLEFTSEFSDGTFVNTRNTLGADNITPPQGVYVSRHRRSLGPKKLLGHHQQAVQEWLQDRPGVSLVPHLTLEGNLQVCHRVQALRIQQHHTTGFGEE